MFAWLLGAEERIIKGHEIFFGGWVHDGYVHYIEHMFNMLYVICYTYIHNEHMFIMPYAWVFLFSICVF